MDLSLFSTTLVSGSYWWTPAANLFALVLVFSPSAAISIFTDLVCRRLLVLVVLVVIVVVVVRTTASVVAIIECAFNQSGLWKDMDALERISRS